MAFNAVSLVRGPGEIALMVVEVTKRIFTRPFQTREFIDGLATDEPAAGSPAAP